MEVAMAAGRLERTWLLAALDDLDRDERGLTSLLHDAALFIEEPLRAQAVDFERFPDGRIRFGGKLLAPAEIRRLRDCADHLLRQAHGRSTPSL